MQPIVTELKAYEDEHGNRIIYDGPGLPRAQVTFRGTGATLIVDSRAHVGNFRVDFNGHNGALRLGANAHKRYFGASIRVGQDSTVTIGDNVSSTAGVVMSAVEGCSLTVGDDVMFASENQVRCDDGHPIFDVTTGERVNPARDITIGDHVWLAWGALVLGGGSIGSGSVIGAHSIVTGAIPNNVVAVGAPARVSRRDIAWERPHLGLTEPFYKPDASTVRPSTQYWNLTED